MKGRKPMAHAAEAEGDWTYVIKPRSRFLSFNLREFLRYRDLVFLFVKRDIQTVYKQTVLGPLWFVIQPIITTIIYTFVFGNLAQLSTDGIPRTLFYFGGTMLWTYFSTTLLNVSDTFVQNAGLFGKVYFPRLAVPASKILSNLVSLGIQALTLAFFYVYYVVTGSKVLPTFSVLLVPVIVLWLAALAAGFGMIISALTTKYRDLRQLMNFGMHLWMYATPVVYPISQLPEKLRWVMQVNPVSAPIELFRSVTFGVPSPEPVLIWTSAATTVVLFFLGILLFHRNEATFVDVA
jgi:lipopolysaccharide transport system permease protein